MKNPDISIIVPVYNKALFLDDFFKCCNQLEEDLSAEIIFVDDGSTDGSWEMVKNYSKTNTTIRCYHQNNSGAGAARNTGIEMAKGEYVTFVDADDLFVPGTVKKALSKVIKSKPDILFCNFKTNLSDKTNPTYTHSEYTFDNFLCNDPVPWGKLFRREFLNSNNVRFNNTRTAEDMFFNCLAQCYNPRIQLMDENLIIYRITENSLSRSIDKCPMAICESFMTITNTLKERNFFDTFEQKALSRYFIKYLIEELSKVNNHNKRKIMIMYNDIFKLFNCTDLHRTNLFRKKYIIIHKLISLRLYNSVILTLKLLELRKNRSEVKLF